MLQRKNDWQWSDKIRRFCYLFGRFRFVLQTRRSFDAHGRTENDETEKQPNINQVNCSYDQKWHWDDA